MGRARGRDGTFVTQAEAGTFAETFQVRGATVREYLYPHEQEELTRSQKFWKWVGLTLLGIVVGYGIRWLVGVATRAIAGPVVQAGLEGWSLWQRYKERPVRTYLEEYFGIRIWSESPWVTMDGEVQSPLEAGRLWDVY